MEDIYENNIFDMVEKDLERSDGRVMVMKKYYMNNDNSNDGSKNIGLSIMLIVTIPIMIRSLIIITVLLHTQLHEWPVPPILPVSSDNGNSSWVHIPAHWHLGQGLTLPPRNGRAWRPVFPGEGVCVRPRAAPYC